ncbi:MAG: hypothetical protein LH679_21260 [Cyanobacteria bacterium CAN_BIN43]|nr:hypothetical protein [Cyanobacteria bacterium CAN_BIN43]
MRGVLQAIAQISILCLSILQTYGRYWLGCDLYLILKRLKLSAGKAFKRFDSSSFDYSLTRFTGTQNPYGAKGGWFFLMYWMEATPFGDARPNRIMMVTVEYTVHRVTGKPHPLVGAEG